MGKLQWLVKSKKKYIYFFYTIDNSNVNDINIIFLNYLFIV